MPITQAERDNTAVWGGGPGFYEVWYLKFNLPAQRAAFWFRYTLSSPVLKKAASGALPAPVAELWGVGFDFAQPERSAGAKLTVPASQARIGRDAFEFSFADAQITQQGCRGRLDQGLELDCHHVETPLQRMEHALHPWVAFLILPVFALANAGLTFQELHFPETMMHPVSLGIILGLFCGKPIGIFLFSYLSVKTGIAALPQGIRWPHIFGVSLLGGIGFTMSLFVSGLSFTDAEFLHYSKFAILFGSVISATAGILLLLAYSSEGSRKI